MLNCLEHISGEHDFGQAMENTAHAFLEWAPRVNTGHWQSVKGTPHSQTRELQNYCIPIQVPPTSGSLAAMVKPNLPWAEDHFLERVSGEPLNPGVQFKNWPWYKGGVEDHKKQGQFSHTYMERYWPKDAGDWEFGDSHTRKGIRYQYGDLNDLITLLRREPYTRQAYLPIWFPEDIHAAAVDGVRVPCSLGYHFMLRDDRLHCFYPMRSVDFVRYLRDDLYLTGRLMQWVIAQLNWQDAILPGSLTLFASSCHIFENDVPKLEREYGTAK